MENQISIITLGCTDLEASIRFYEEGLGFPRQPFDSDKIAFFRLHAGQVLALFPMDELAKDAALPLIGDDRGFRGMTLAHNVSTRDEVDALLAQAHEAGARILKPAQEPPWGGWSGYFADPDGHAWEIAYPKLEFKD